MELVTAYIRALEIHSLDAVNKSIVQIHVVPNNGGSAGTASSVTRIARLGISTEDTYFFENAYPITLPSNGDTIQIQNEHSEAVNVLVLGDKEVLLDKCQEKVLRQTTEVPTFLDFL